ncbi:MAG TPA: hypothetical protein VFQ72_03900 [Candidatus Paceibacterota bacterium]|nr:hypothetical protein [Candidatus Paceibacterota bacterium]
MPAKHGFVRDTGEELDSKIERVASRIERESQDPFGHSNGVNGRPIEAFSEEEVYDEFINACGHIGTIENEKKLAPQALVAEAIDPLLRIQRLDQLEGKRRHVRAPGQAIKEEELAVASDNEGAISECSCGADKTCQVCVTDMDLMAFPELKKDDRVLIDSVPDKRGRLRVWLPVGLAEVLGLMPV